MLPETGTDSWPAAEISPTSEAGSTVLRVQLEAPLRSAELALHVDTEALRPPLVSPRVRNARGTLVRKLSSCSLSPSGVLSFTSQSLPFSVYLEAAVPRILLDGESYCFPMFVCV